MDRVVASAPAKINLALRVGAPRPDGFHPLDTVFEAIDIVDDVEARRADSLSLTISGLGEDLPVDETNLAIRAAHALIKHAGLEANPPGAALHITKRIPVAGGMAGGSADAAGTLVALNELWGLKMETSRLLEIGAELGSDVPFSLHGFLAHGTGRGEHLTPITTKGRHGWVLVTSRLGLSTPAVFRAFDQRGGLADPENAVVPPPSTRELREALVTGDLHSVASYMINDLQPVAASMRADLKNLLELLDDAGRATILSGSGPTIAILTDVEGVAATKRRVLDLLSSLPGSYEVLTAEGPAAGARIIPDVGPHANSGAGLSQRT